MQTLKIIRIATRTSPLAIWQAKHVKNLIEQANSLVKCSLIPLQTAGDQSLDDSLACIGGKGLFVKELEQALLEDRADIAVHSMKDVPIYLPKDLIIAAYIKREDPRDSFISNKYSSLKDLPPNAIIGTSSLRRSALIKHYFPQLKIHLLRGNIQTRLKKLDDKKYDALILAAAGLKRLKLKNRIKDYLAVDYFIPAINQGILGVECRNNHQEIIEAVKKINHSSTQKIAEAERAFNCALGGSCHMPIGGFATLQQEEIHMSGLISDKEGKKYLLAQQQGILTEGHEKVGILLAEQLFAQGAQVILDSLEF